MPEALFRTNHGYDPIIVDHLRSKLQEKDDSMIRYRILKNGFNWYKENQRKRREIPRDIGFFYGLIFAPSLSLRASKVVLYNFKSPYP